MKVIFLFPCGCQWTQLFSFFVRWFGILALVCLSEFLLPAAAAAESFTAVGSGPTEQAAIQDAFRQAIRVQRGISLSADTYVINQQVARDQMHASMQGHIRSYRLLDSHFDGESYQVRLQVEIADGVFCQVKIPIFIKIIPHRHHGEIPTFSEVIRMQIS